MRAARRIVAFFMILATVGWSLFLLVGCALILRFVVNASGEGFWPALGSFCSVCAFLFAWSCHRVYHLVANVLIVPLSIVACVFFWIGGGAGFSLVALIKFGQLSMVIVGLPMIVAGGFAFLRMTRDHPALAKANTAEGSWKE